MTSSRVNTTDLALAALAGRQAGVFADWQLRVLAIAPPAIRRRVAAGRLSVLHDGVYAFGHRCLSPEGHRLAAVLALGPHAVASHRTAGAMWELLETSQGRIDVTVPGGGRRPRPGIRVHRTRCLLPDEVTLVGPIPTTTIARTVLDLAGALSRDRLRRTIEQADRSGLLDLAALQVQIDRHPARRGTCALRQELAAYAEPPFTRSELERRFLELVCAGGLPTPLVNVPIAGFEVDFLWPQWRLVAELDGRAYHSDPRRFEGDRTRDIVMMRCGYRVVRFTYRRVVYDPARVLADLRALTALPSPG